MVSTKHCCWGKCASDSRYPEKLPKSLQEMEASGQKAFIPFPKPSQGIEKCQRWVSACSRENFDVSKITRNTYICAVHWPGERGPTDEHPDPLKARFTPREIAKACARKRKAPTERLSFSKKIKTVEQTGDSSGSSLPGSELDEGDREQEYVSPTSGMTTNKETQTEYSKYMLSAKLETMLLRNEATIANPSDATNIIPSLSYENISKYSSSMKHFTGMNSEQFEALYSFLDNVCPLDNIVYHTATKQSQASRKSKFKKTGPEPNFSNREKLFICLVRLRRGFTLKTLATLLSSPTKSIETTMISKIFTTFIQLMYKVFRDMEEVMFPPRSVLIRFLPRVFKTMRKIRCVVDCTEFSVQTSRNFARQGNTYSSYKHTNTFKCLISVAPNGCACFVSDLYEGDIDDVHIFKECGILKHINPDDIIMVDRGFTVQHLLNPLHAELKIPSFLKGRKNLSAAEELESRKIAKARIHVERFNERLKQFRLIGRKIALSLSPLATQMVVVACGLVNFQNVLCK